MIGAIFDVIFRHLYNRANGFINGRGGTSMNNDDARAEETMSPAARLSLGISIAAIALSAVSTTLHVMILNGTFNKSAATAPRTDMQGHETTAPRVLPPRARG